MTSAELISALVDAKVPGMPAALAKLATSLEERGVTRRDILLVADHIRRADGHTEAVVGKLLATLLVSPGAWEERLVAARGSAAGSSGLRLEPARRRTGGYDLHEERIKDYTAHGCTREEALRYELGGYLHEAMVGDGKLPADAGKDHGLDPWDVVQLASAWAQRFGGGTDRLRKHLASRASLHRLTAKKWAIDAADKGRHLERADALEGLLCSVPYHRVRGVPEPQGATTCG